MNLFKDLLGKNVKFAFLVQDGMIFFHLTPIFRAWRKLYFNEEDRIIRLTSAHAFLRSQPGFLELGVAKKINGHIYRCVAFNAQKAPPELHALLKPL